MKHPIWFIGNAHIDPVWLWRWQEGFSEIKATFRSALDRMKEFDDFVFTCAGASYYQWVEESEPEMFEEIRQRVKEGRWILAGGWWLQPDCNIPCGESFARHSLYSQLYYRKTFGTQAKFGYNVDSFGHNGNLPQILAKSEMPRYVMMRPMEVEKALNADAFNWKGVDGTVIPVFRIPIAYCTPWDGKGFLDRLNDIKGRVEAKDEPYMYFYGVGNHGGGPTVRELRMLSKEAAENGDLHFGNPDDYFSYVEKNGSLHLTVEGDLQHHAIGCYSARSEIKRNNRRAENRLLAAEKLMAAAKEAAKLPDYEDKLRRAWQGVMFNQFHDIMGGCAIKAAYEDARDLHGEALKLSGEVLNAASQRISWHIDTLGGRDLSVTDQENWSDWENTCGGYPVVVFNTNAFPVDACVPLTRPLTGVTDENGEPLPFQNIRAEKTVNHLMPDNEAVVALRLPAMGYRTIYIRQQSACPKKYESTGRKLFAGNHFMENDWVRLEFDRASGALCSLVDKTTGRQTLAAPALAEVIEDYQNDTWAHARNELTGTIGTFGHGKLTLRERGEVLAMMRCESSFEGSTLTQDFTIYRDKPDIDVRVSVNWQEKFRILKMTFPMKGENTEAVYEIPYGFIRKKANGEEEAAQSWACVEGEQDGKPVSLAVVTDSHYSYCVDKNVLKFIAVRSAGAADHFGIKDDYTQVMDLGINEFGYSIVPGGKADTADLTRRGAHKNQAPFAVYETFHKGELPLTAEYASVDNGAVLLNVIKPAEDGNGLIVRASETAGEAAHARIDLKFAGISFEVDFAPLEIKSFRVADGKITEVDLLETDV